MRDKLFAYVKHGPNAGTNIPEMVLGLCLHYVFWAMILIGALLLYASSWIATWNYPIESLVLFGAMAGWIAALTFEKIADTDSQL